MGLPLLPDPYSNPEVVGSGAFGIVVRARDHMLDRDVAIKLVPHRDLDDRTIDRFVDEAKRVARLQHPNVVTIHSAGIHDDHLYLVMEYATGGTLADQIPESGGIPMNDALRYLDEAAKGLDYAHMNGVVHQDVKPTNLLVDAHDAVKVADFGLAREMDRSSATRGGTLFYAAPEKWDPDLVLTPATDVFALAMTAWELLTGHPHGGLARIASTGIEASSRISDVLVGAPVKADRVFAAAFAIEPTMRTQSTTEFVNQLRSALGSAPSLQPTMHHAPGRRRRPAGAIPMFDDRLSLLDDEPMAARSSTPSVLRDGGSLAIRHTAAQVAVRDTDWFLGVKWSGSVKPQQRGTGIWVAVVNNGVLYEIKSGCTREEAIDFILSNGRNVPRVTVGIDFGFSVPAWFIDEQGWRSALQLWDYLDSMEQHRGVLTQWPAHLTLPFWGPNIRTRPDIPAGADWFRQTENDVREMTGAVPKSVFQLTGAGSVGGMSVRGMPQLKRMRDQGWSVWPFDPPTSHTALEVFPRSLLLALATPGTKPSRDEVRDDVMAALPPAFLSGDSDLGDLLAANHTAFEAAFAAWSLWADGAELPDLSQDPIAQREGRIWLPE